MRFRAREGSGTVAATRNVIAAFFCFAVGKSLLHGCGQTCWRCRSYARDPVNLGLIIVPVGSEAIRELAARVECEGNAYAGMGRVVLGIRVINHSCRLTSMP